MGRTKKRGKRAYSKVQKTQRCQSGIPGFDRLCQGGFVKNSVNMVVGGPGSGKTTFLLQFLWHGLRTGENGLYVSFESDLLEVMQDAYAYGWDFSKFDQQGKCRFLRLSPSTKDNEIENQLLAAISKYDIKRICFDPITAFAMTIEKESLLREAVYSLGSLLKRFKATVVLSEEISGEVSLEGGRMLTRYGVLEFLADSFIMLHNIGIGGTADRAIRIVKMRRTNHFRGPVPMQITDNGIIVIPEQD